MRLQDIIYIDTFPFCEFRHLIVELMDKWTDLEQDNPHELLDRQPVHLLGSFPAKLMQLIAFGLAGEGLVTTSKIDYLVNIPPPVDDGFRV